MYGHSTGRGAEFERGVGGVVYGSGAGEGAVYGSGSGSGCGGARNVCAGCADGVAYASAGADAAGDEREGLGAAGGGCSGGGGTGGCGVVCAGGEALAWGYGDERDEPCGGSGTGGREVCGMDGGGDGGGVSAGLASCDLWLQDRLRATQARSRSFDCATHDEAVRCFAQDDNVLGWDGDRVSEARRNPRSQVRPGAPGVESLRGRYVESTVRQVTNCAKHGGLPDLRWSIGQWNRGNGVWHGKCIAQGQQGI